MFRDDFPILNEDIIYFNNAATTLKPKVVIDEITAYYEKYSFNLNRGVDSKAYHLTKRYENVRQLVADFINAIPSEIVFTRGTTEGINMLARGFIENLINEGDEIIISILEHHSNFLPWQELCKRKKAKLVVVDINEQGQVTKEALEKVITSKTKVVSLFHVSNTLGSENNLKELSELIHKFNAIFIVDGAQAIATKQLNVKEANIDFYTFSAHKLYGPTGVGVLYGKKELLDKMQPFHFGGEMVAETSLETSKYKQTPHKFEAGTMMIAQVLGMGRAIEYLKKISQKNTMDFTYKLRDYFLNRLKKEIPEIIIYNEEVKNTPLILFNINKIHSHDLASYLDKHNIIVRAGHHCAEPLMKYLNVLSTVRISLAFYNTEEEIDKVVEVLKKVGDNFEFLF